MFTKYIKKNRVFGYNRFFYVYPIPNLFKYRVTRLSKILNSIPDLSDPIYPNSKRTGSSNHVSGIFNGHTLEHLKSSINGKGYQWWCRSYDGRLYRRKNIGKSLKPFSLRSFKKISTWNP